MKRSRRNEWKKRCSTCREEEGQEKNRRRREITKKSGIRKRRRKNRDRIYIGEGCRGIVARVGVRTQEYKYQMCWCKGLLL